MVKPDVAKKPVPVSSGSLKPDVPTPKKKKTESESDKKSDETGKEAKKRKLMDMINFKIEARKKSQDLEEKEKDLKRKLRKLEQEKRDLANKINKARDNVNKADKINKADDKANKASASKVNKADNNKANKADNNKANKADKANDKDKESDDSLASCSTTLIGNDDCPRPRPDFNLE